MVAASKKSEKSIADERREIFDKTLKEIRKDYGDDIAVVANGGIDVETVSTGSWAIDSILGGGFPKGRLIEVFGPEASGKTSIALNAIGDIQKRGGIAVFIDLENALDPRYAASLGVDVDNLIVCRPESGEQAEMIMEKFITSGAVDIIVLDSIAAMVSEKELAGDITKDTIALRARLMSKLVGRITHPAAATGTICLFINQLRTNPGVMYGNPMDTMGGKAMKYFASQRIEVRRKKPELDKNGVLIGTPVAVKVVKNKIAPPYQTCEAFLANGKGIDRDNELFDLCEKFGIIKRSGSWYKDAKTDEMLGQGKPAVLEKIRANEDGIRDKYIPLMEAAMASTGSADLNVLLEKAIERGDKDMVAALQSKLYIKSSDGEEEE